MKELLACIVSSSLLEIAIFTFFVCAEGVDAALQATSCFLIGILLGCYKTTEEQGIATCLSQTIVFLLLGAIFLSWQWLIAVLIAIPLVTLYLSDISAIVLQISRGKILRVVAGGSLFLLGILLLVALLFRKGG